MSLDAVIFDVDGTLADTEEAHRQAFNATFKEFGLPWHWDVALYVELLAVAVLLGALNATLGVLLKRIAFLPVACTLGCFSLVINGLVFWLAGALSHRLGLGFRVEGFWSGFFGALVTSLTAGLLERIVIGKEVPPQPEPPRKIKIIKEGKYSVVAMTKDGCETTAEFDVVISPVPAKPVIERYNSTQLIATESAKYQWFRNDTLLKNDTSRVLVVTELGKYSVKVSNIQGCSALSDSYEVLTSIDENKYSFDVYPNPTKGIVYFSDKLNGMVINSIKLMNSEGKEINNKLTRENSEYVMDISDLSSGVYFIQINFGSETIVRKVIKY